MLSLMNIEISKPQLMLNTLHAYSLHIPPILYTLSERRAPSSFAFPLVDFKMDKYMKYWISVQILISWWRFYEWRLNTDVWSNTKYTGESTPACDENFISRGAMDWIPIVAMVAGETLREHRDCEASWAQQLGSVSRLYSQSTSPAAGALWLSANSQLVKRVGWSKLRW